MSFNKAKFVKGVMGDDDALRDDKAQVAFIGRSNVGKSSVINSLANAKLTRVSDKPGKTKEINLYLMQKDLYFVDLPGYGYAQASLEERDNLRKLITWYLLFSDIRHKIIVIVIDANVGLTEFDTTILRRMEEREKKIIIVANKIDKIKSSELSKKMANIKQKAGNNLVIKYSAKNRTGLEQLSAAILK